MFASIDRVLPRDRAARRALYLGSGLAWVIAMIAVQWELGDRLVIVPWLALGPLTVSLLLEWKRTALVSCLSVAAVVVLSAKIGDLASHQAAIRIAGSAALAVFAVVSSQIRVRREERIRRVTEVAAVAQATILHPVPVAVGGLTLASRYVSASADSLVGGDLYDVVSTSSGVRLLLGDARGKGLPAVQTAATVLSAFRAVAPRERVSLERLAREIETTLRARLGEEDFVTAVLAEIRADGTLLLVNCGHPRPLLLTHGRDPSTLGTWSSPPLGLGVSPREERFALGPGERVLLFTDGLVEARDARGAFYDLGPAARDLVSPSPASSGTHGLEAGLDRLMDSVRHHVGGNLTDDVAVLLVELPFVAAAVPLSAAPADAS